MSALTSARMESLCTGISLTIVMMGITIMVTGALQTGLLSLIGNVLEVLLHKQMFVKKNVEPYLSLGKTSAMMETTYMEMDAQAYAP